MGEVYLVSYREETQGADTEIVYVGDDLDEALAKVGEYSHERHGGTARSNVILAGWYNAEEQWQYLFVGRMRPEYPRLRVPAVDEWIEGRWE